MKISRNNLIALILLILATALFRMIPYDFRDGWLGAPQLAMAIFAGSVIKDKKWAFALPIFSLLLSDLVMQVMYWNNPNLIPGFYEGQLINYLLIASLTTTGFFISHRKPLEIGIGALAAPIIFFLLSNFAVWAGKGPGLDGLPRPMTMAGLMQVYAEAIPFLKSSLSGTFIWAGVLFGSYSLFTKPASNTVAA